MIDTVTLMREARKKPHRYLTDYLNLRSRLGEVVFICIFEGFEDLPVYDTWIKRINHIVYEPLAVDGKENVLDLNVLVKNLKSDFDKHVLFFVDHDFDGTKGRDVDGRCYITSTYSIENFLISEDILEEILKRDLKMLGDEHSARSTIIELFRSRLDEFNRAIVIANSYIKWLRTENIECNLPDKVSEFIAVTLESVDKKQGVNVVTLANIFKAKAIPLPPVIDKLADEFGREDISIVGRGKFHLDFFRRFLAQLYDDRRSEKPKYFPVKVRTCIDPTNDFMRKLAAHARCPRCLESFLETKFNLACN